MTFQKGKSSLILLDYTDLFLLQTVLAPKESTECEGHKWFDLYGRLSDAMAEG